VKGPYLLCPNHASYLDGFFVYSSLNLNAAAQAFFLGYSQIIEHPSIKWATKLARLIPIDPGVNLIDAMQVSSWVLLNGKVICIFPEGKRSIDDKAGEFKKGVGILIKELNVPVIPVYIKNSHYSWPRGLRLPRLCPITVNFGRPFLLEELLTDNGKGQTDDYELIVRNLREEVLRLSC